MAQNLTAAIGTPFTPSGRKALLLGSGELGKEVAIELQRYGVQVVACDKYPGAPAMQVANSFRVFNMLDGDALRQVVEEERPDHIIPEVEAIATPTLVALEKEGWNVTPTAHATLLTMNREGIRRLAAEELGITTSPYRFASTEEEYRQAIQEIGMPCVVKPVMSSSGHGQSTVRTPEDVTPAWHEAQEGGRAGAGRVIVEGFVDFDYEITMLTVRSVSGTAFCEPVGHIQESGDYRYSWQPQPMTSAALESAREIARKVTDALGGYGIFGVELFVKGDQVIFSEVSPRPHDTGMVTMISQDLSEFALHTRAILGLPIPEIRFFGPSASRAIVVEGDSREVVMSQLDQVLAEPGTQIRIFGKPEVKGHRRMGVILATADTVDEARAKASRAYDALQIHLK
jgi:phosphoribosylglycinamide formyltransferase 2